MIHSEQDGERETQGQSGQSGFVESARGLNSHIIRTSVKSIQTNSGQVRGNSRTTSRRVTWSYKLISRQAQTPEFAGMNSSSVHGTRSWGGPSIDSLFIDTNGHREFTIDSVNIGPTERKAAQWVRNSDSFIEEINFRAMKYKIEANSNESTPHDCNEEIINTAHVTDLDNQSQQSYVDNPRGNRSRLWPKTFEVGHSAILTHLNEEKINV